MWPRGHPLSPQPHEWHCCAETCGQSQDLEQYLLWSWDSALSEWMDEFMDECLTGLCSWLGWRPRRSPSQQPT